MAANPHRAKPHRPKPANHGRRFAGMLRILLGASLVAHCLATQAAIARLTLMLALKSQGDQNAGTRARWGRYRASSASHITGNMGAHLPKIV